MLARRRWRPILYLTREWKTKMSSCNAATTEVQIIRINGLAVSRASIMQGINCNDVVPTRVELMNLKSSGLAKGHSRIGCNRRGPVRRPQQRKQFFRVVPVLAEHGPSRAKYRSDTRRTVLQRRRRNGSAVAFPVAQYSISASRSPLPRATPMNRVIAVPIPRSMNSNDFHSGSEHKTILHTTQDPGSGKTAGPKPNSGAVTVNNGAILQSVCRLMLIDCGWPRGDFQRSFWTRAGGT